MMTNGRVILLALVALVGIACYGCSERMDSDGTQELLTEAEESGIAGEIRRSGIDIKKVLDQLEVAESDSVIHISLFEDFSIHGRLISKTIVLPGVTSYQYEVEIPVSGILIISVEGSSIMANIDLSDISQYFIIQPVQNTGDHVVIEIDPAGMDILDGGTPLTPQDK
jgi:hypothetical protein